MNALPLCAKLFPPGTVLRSRGHEIFMETRIIRPTLHLSISAQLFVLASTFFLIFNEESDCSSSQYKWNRKALKKTRDACVYKSHLDIDRSVHLAQRRSGAPILNEKLDKVENLLRTRNLEQAFGRSILNFNKNRKVR